MGRSSKHHRPGQALVEFAIVAFAATLLLSAMIAYGLMLFSAQVLQQAADVGAQELARLPLPPSTSFSDALQNPVGDQQTLPLFDEKLLVLSANADVQLPLINRLLQPLYIYDPQDPSDPSDDLRRFPGTLVRTPDGVRTVLIPVVSHDAGTQQAAISHWLPVVEEIEPDTFALTTAPDSGVVKLQINYPYQSAAMVAYQYLDQNGQVVSPRDVVGQKVRNIPIAATDSAVQHAELPSGYTLDGGPATYGAHSGTFGLGSVNAHAIPVRPFRKLLSAQGIYRREVFSAETIPP